MKKHIYLIRHGRQNSRICNLDVPLSPEGREQAELLGKRIAGCSYDLFLTSSLKRAVETGDIVNEYLKMDITHCPELDEIDWGDLTGKSPNEIYEVAPAFMVERMKRTSDLPFPGGETGEEAFLRAYPIMKLIEESDYRNVLIISHGGTIRSLIVGLLGLNFKDRLAFGENLENTSISEFAYDTERKSYTLERLNDFAHLESTPRLMRSGWK